MSDLLLNLLKLITSGAAHFIGNLVPSDAVYSSSITNLQYNEKHIYKVSYSNNKNNKNNKNNNNNNNNFF